MSLENHVPMTKVSYKTVKVGDVLGCLGGAAAISLGLGTRSVSQNIISGVYIREQLKPGDQVVIGDFEGTVVSR